MKRLIAALLIFSAVISLTACGTAAKAPVDLQKVYDSLTMPEMMVLDDVLMSNLFGIEAADCEQVITAICVNSLLADEVWLIRAKDKDAMERLTALAKSRMEAKAEEWEFYNAEQYAVVKQGQIVTNGLYLALLVGADSAAMKAEVDKALK